MAYSHRKWRHVLICPAYRVSPQKRDPDWKLYINANVDGEFL